MKEKPVILLALDNSQSVLLNADSATYKNDFLKDADRLSDKLGSMGEVRRYSFGSEADQLPQDGNYYGNLDFSGEITDISGLIAGLGNLYTNVNVGALILATDGIYNTGTNPVYQAGKWPYPIYTIAMGDTSIRKDLVLAKANYNRIVYLNNRFPLEVVVRARGAAGNESKVSIIHNGNVLQSTGFVIDKDDFTQEFRFVLDARSKGLQKYSIQIDQISGELSSENNRKDIFLEVLDSKSKVLIVAGAPHPDIAALSQAITSNLNYEAEEVMIQDFSGRVEDYSMVVLYQLPSVNEPAEKLISDITAANIPVLYITGLQSDLARFNRQKPGMSVTSPAKPLFEEAVPSVNKNFTAFSLSENVITWFNDLPPLVAPLGDYQVSNSARVLLNQRIGNVETSKPLLLVSETLDGRSGVISGEGIWKWRLFDYARNQSHDAFNELVNKIVQFLSLKEQKKKFRVYNAGNFNENEHVIFDAEFYNENYELTTDPEVRITIQNEDGNQFPFVFNKSGNAYHLDAGVFPPGNYSFRAGISAGSTDNDVSGQFSVSSIDLEALHTVADHNLLFQLSRDSGGKMYHVSEMDELADELLTRDDIRPVTYTQRKYEDLLNKGWLFLLIIGLLSLEWFMRKRAGAY